MTNGFVAGADSLLFVRRWGEADGLPLIFIHSLGPAASAALLDVGMGPIAAAGYSVAAPDMPGFGRSPAVTAPEYAIPQLARRIWALADGLGWQQVVLAGHSWGGTIAMHAAAVRPDRTKALVLADSGHLDFYDEPGVDSGWTMTEWVEHAEQGRFRARDRAEVARELELPQDDPVVDSFMEGFVEDDEGALISRTVGPIRGAALFYLAHASVVDQWPAIAAARTPTLLLLATEPPATKAMNREAAIRFKAAIPHADVQFIDGATHSIITDLRESFGNKVTQWLSTSLT